MKTMCNKIIITMPELMDQMDISDKTLHRMIEEGDLPDFSYGSRTSKKKGWHSAVLERHAMEKYEKSQSIKNANDIIQVGGRDVIFVPRRGNTSKSNNLKRDNKEGGKRKRNSSKNSIVAAGFVGKTV